MFCGGITRLSGWGRAQVPPLAVQPSCLFPTIGADPRPRVRRVHQRVAVPPLVSPKHLPAQWTGQPKVAAEEGVKSTNQPKSHAHPFAFIPASTSPAVTKSLRFRLSCSATTVSNAAFLVSSASVLFAHGQGLSILSATDAVAMRRST